MVAFAADSLQQGYAGGTELRKEQQEVKATDSDFGSDDDELKFADFLKVCSTSDKFAQLEECFGNLDQLVSSLADSDPTTSASIKDTLGNMRLVSLSLSAENLEGTNTASKPSSMRTTQILSDSGYFRRATAVARRNSIPIEVSFRDQAKAIVEQTGKLGEMIDDLEEVNVKDVANKHAVGYWRCCAGVRFFKSKTVSKALRLICSAPVPGLEKTSYLDVFKSLTSQATCDWEHHIYVWGGLVRDILRRKVGNDIDTVFTAPAVELEEICTRNGYKCDVDGDYILIGDGKGAEYLEGMVISYNSCNAAYHSDFSMNWVFYDFINDIIIDKTGMAVDAIKAFRCELPCPPREWQNWIEWTKLFRFYKFLLRDYAYHKQEMAFVAHTLLKRWTEEPEATIEDGRMVLSSNVSAKNQEKLRELVYESFDLAASSWTGSADDATAQANIGNFTKPVNCPFTSASSWWEKGWLPMLKLEQ